MFFRCLYLYLGIPDEQNNKILKSKYFYKFVNSMWNSTKPLVHLFAFSNILVHLVLFAQGFIIHHNPTGVQVCSIVLIVTKTLFATVELQNIFLWNTALLEARDCFDLAAFVASIVSSIWLFADPHPDTGPVSVYIVAWIFAFGKFYCDLRNFEGFRTVSYAITIIFLDNANFFVLMGMFIVIFAEIFYITDFWNEHDIFPKDKTKSYIMYMYWSWEFVFGNYSYGTPKFSDLYWITIGNYFWLKEI
jgi:hypothetical protein